MGRWPSAHDALASPNLNRLGARFEPFLRRVLLTHSRKGPKRDEIQVGILQGQHFHIFQFFPIRLFFLYALMVIDILADGSGFSPRTRLANVLWSQRIPSTKFPRGVSSARWK